MAYPTLDYLPDLTTTEMANARTLTFAPYIGSSSTWDYSATVGGFDEYALLHGIYKVQAKAGATYDMASISYFDPFILMVYDQYGNAIAANDEADDPPDFYLTDGYYGVDALWGLVAPYSGTFYISASWHQGTYFKYYNLSVYEDVNTIPGGQSINGTESANTLVGTMAADTINGFGGNDLITSNGGSDTINGGAGIDTVILPGGLADYSIVRNGTNATLVGNNATISLANVERVWMGNQKLALDVEGNAGQAYRLYQAAFDRVPDIAGLGFQMKTLDDGWSLGSVAANFIASPEFSSKYGSLNNTQFVTQLYANVLHRAPDADGLAYHLDRLSHGVQKESILVGFSESPENQANVIGAINSGMLYIV